MRPGLKRGARVELRVKVRPWMRPRPERGKRHRLYSTWAMVYHMEAAARRLLAPYLEPDEAAIGAGVALEHLAPAPVGADIRLVCIASRIKKNKIYTHLDVFWKNRKIGRGSYMQVVMPRRRFAAKVRQPPPSNGHPSRN